MDKSPLTAVTVKVFSPSLKAKRRGSPWYPLASMALVVSQPSLSLRDTAYWLPRTSSCGAAAVHCLLTAKPAASRNGCSPFILRLYSPSPECADSTRQENSKLARQAVILKVKVWLSPS